MAEQISWWRRAWRRLFRLSPPSPCEVLSTELLGDVEWEALRTRSILLAFQTGRPVYADATGVVRFADGNKEVAP